MEDAIIGLFWGLVFGTPAGWFLRSAAQWRREAKRAGLPPVVPAPIAQPLPPPAPESRTERLLERLNQRLETLEDRLDFAERLLDARASRSHGEPHEPRLHPVRETTPQR